MALRPHGTHERHVVRRQIRRGDVELMAAIGVTSSYLHDEQRGVAGVQQNIAYKRELFAGSVVEIRSHLHSSSIARSSSCTRCATPNVTSSARSASSPPCTSTPRIAAPCQSRRTSASAPNPSCQPELRCHQHKETSPVHKSTRFLCRLALLLTIGSAAAFAAAPKGRGNAGSSVDQAGFLNDEVSDRDVELRGRQLATPRTVQHDRSLLDGSHRLLDA